jgi:hypothetical protein
MKKGQIIERYINAVKYFRVLELKEERIDFLVNLAII